jgi:serine/threonine protein kinase
MGIKAIKSVENNLQPDPIFELQGMVKIRKDPITNEYKFIRKIGAGTYGEVFEAEHESTGQHRAVKKINTFKFPRAKTMTLSEVSLLKRMVAHSQLRTTPAFLKYTRYSRRLSTST